MKEYINTQRYKLWQFRKRIEVKCIEERWFNDMMVFASYGALMIMLGSVFVVLTM